MEQTIAMLIGQIGFPIFTAVYFMTRMEKQMSETNKLLSVLVDRERNNGNE